MRGAKSEWTLRITLLGVCLLAFATFVGVADADNSSRAEELNAEGKKLVKQLDLEGAADRFRQAMKLADDPRYAFNLCYTLEKTNNFEEARLACKRVEEAGNSRLAAKATKLLVKIEKKIAEKTPVAPAPQPVAPAPQPAAPSPQPARPALQPTGPAPQPIPPAYATGSAPPPYGNVQQNFYRPQQRTHRYRMHVFLADVASFSFLLAGAGSESEGITSLGVGGLIFGSPLVHIFQSNSRGAYLSLGARLGFPLAGALLLAGSCDAFDCFEEIATGATLGFAGALVLDWFVFAEKTEWVNAPVQPTVSLTSDRAGAIAGLRFSL